MPDLALLHSTWHTSHYSLRAHHIDGDTMDPNCMGFPACISGFMSIAPNRATTDNTNSQPQSGSAETAASSLTRGIPTDETSGNTLSVLPRSIELSATEPPFLAVTQTPITASIIPNTSTTHLHIGAAHRSTSILSGVPQTLPSTHTNRTSLSGLGKHRATIQTTVNKLGDLVERFRTLVVEATYETATNIPLII